MHTSVARPRPCPTPRARLALALLATALSACGAASEGDLDAESGRGSDGATVDAPVNADARSDAPADATNFDATPDAPRGDASSLDATPDARADAARADTGTGADAMVHCTAPRVDCNNTCVNTDTDERNCGRCGHSCLAGETCLNGACSLNATCPPVRFPAVTIQSVPSATMEQIYQGIASGSCHPVPHCFIDLNNLEDPDNGQSLGVHVMISAHFELYEFVATEINGGYSHFALLSPSLVSHLESLRSREGGNPISIASGYRSPQHQQATCRSICPGGANCCPTAAHPCGCRSEHEWGRAADLSIPSSEYSAYGRDADAAGFPDCLLEAGSFHVDVSPCPLGCPYQF